MITSRSTITKVCRMMPSDSVSLELIHCHSPYILPPSVAPISISATYPARRNSQRPFGDGRYARGSTGRAAGREGAEARGVGARGRTMINSPLSPHSFFSALSVSSVVNPTPLQPQRSQRNTEEGRTRPILIVILIVIVSWSEDYDYDYE